MRRLGLPLVIGLALLVVGQACSGSSGQASPQTRLELARKAFLAGDYARAEEGYQQYLQAVKTGPGRVEAWLRLIDIARLIWGNPASAATLLDAAMLEVAPEDPAMSDLLAAAVDVALQTGNGVKALGYLDLLAARKDLSSSRRVWLALNREKAFTLRHDLPGARQVLDACRQADTPAAVTAPCSLRLAALLSDSGQAEPAQAIWRALMEDGTIDAKYRAQAGFFLAEAAEARHDKDAARRFYEAIKDTYPNPLVVKRKLEYLEK
jgi:tetratricopeptide (TPR) repeat protein